MTSALEDATLERLVQKMAPGGSLLRAWNLSGGISAGMTAFELQDAPGAQGSERRLILRRPGAAALSHNPNAAAKEFNLLQALHAQGLRVPAPCLLDTSQEIFSTPYLVIEYIEGRAEFDPADLGAFSREMAAQLARIHRADGAGLNLKTIGMSEGIGQKREGFNLALEEGRIRAVLERVWPLAARNAPALLHCDFWPGNLLWREGRIAAVIDWEDARLGDPLTDLAIARLDLICIFGEKVMQDFSVQYRARTRLDTAQQPYWDLWAALRFIRLAGSDLAGWAAYYPPLGRADISAQSLQAALLAFITQAFDHLPG